MDLLSVAVYHWCIETQGYQDEMKALYHQPPPREKKTRTVNHFSWLPARVLQLHPQPDNHIGTTVLGCHMIQPQGHLFACSSLLGNLLVCENILSGTFCISESSLEKVWLHHHKETTCKTLALGCKPRPLIQARFLSCHPRDKLRE